jgi:hypothetical protein
MKAARMRKAPAAAVILVGHNRLATLASDINAAHAAVAHRSRTTVLEMMGIGDDLHEAKRLVGHGNWAIWRKANCPDISERTCHLYMQLSKWRKVVEAAMTESATIADFERDRAAMIPGGFGVGPFGVVDAIAAIHAAEAHEARVKENRLQMAAKVKRRAFDEAQAKLRIEQEN